MASLKATTVLSTSVRALALHHGAYGRNICSKLYPKEGTSQTSGFQSAASAPHLECSVRSACNYLLYFLQVALRHCSSQLIVNSPLLHCPTFAPGRLLKFYFIIFSNLMHGGLLFNHRKTVAERSPGSSATQRTATTCIVQQSEYTSRFVFLMHFYNSVPNVVW